MPPTPVACRAQRSPSQRPTRTKLRLSSLTSPYWPSRTCQNSTDSQKPLSGAWAKVHGQGTAQLQLSNQSPTMCQLGTSLIRALRSDALSPTIAFVDAVG